ncbi:tyrosine-type recombinase/integrase [Nitrosomonas aestuarii]|nr:site-specific integrase [Nitrosomonas aestuarii]
MASIRKKDNGSYEAMVSRKGVRRSRSFRTKAQAAAWAVDVERDILSNKYSGIQNRPFADLLQQYASKVSPTKRGCRWEVLRIDAMCRDPIAAVMLPDLSSVDFVDFRDRRLKVVSPGTVLREFNLLNHAINVAIDEWGWLSENPLKSVKRPKPPPARDRRLSQDEIDRLLYALGYEFDSNPGTVSARVGAAMLFAIETAMRAGEVCGLTWRDVDLDARVAFLPKTKNGFSRKVPLSAEAIRLIGQMDKCSESVFNLQTSQVDVLFRKAVKRSMIDDLHFHDTRAEAITRLAAKVDILTLARISGHRDLRQLQIYYRESMEDVAKRI